MHYLYGIKTGKPMRLVATFSSEQQLLAYVRWATLKEDAETGKAKFEQGSVLVGCEAWQHSDQPLTNEDEAEVDHNPTPSML